MGQMRKIELFAAAMTLATAAPAFADDPVVKPNDGTVFGVPLPTVSAPGVSLSGGFD